jgi:hypothetical protein
MYTLLQPRYATDVYMSSVVYTQYDKRLLM